MCSAKRPSTPFELNVKFEDLEDMKDELIKIFKYCLRRIAEALEELEKALDGLSPRVLSHFRIDGTNATDKYNIRKIIANYQKIADVLLGHKLIRYNGEETGPAFGLGKIIGVEPPGYVRQLGVEPGEEGEIKIVKGKFKKSTRDDKARIIIHEIAHVFLGVHDRKYYRGGRVIKLSTEMALDNADTYANFVVPKDLSPSLKVPMSGKGSATITW